MHRKLNGTGANSAHISCQGFYSLSYEIKNSQNVLTFKRKILIGGFHIVNQVVIQQVTLVQNVSSGRELKTT